MPKAINSLIESAMRQIKRKHETKQSSEKRKGGPSQHSSNLAA